MDTIEPKDKIDMQKRHGRDSTALSSCGRVISDTKMNKKMSIISAPSRYSDHIEYVCVSTCVYSSVLEEWSIIICLYKSKIVS